MSMTNEQREAIKTMQHWIEYEKEHQNEINKAEELIHIQDTVLSLIKEQEIYIKKYNDTTEEMNRDIRKLISEIQKKDKQIDLMAEEIIMTKPANCTRTNEFNTEKVYMSKEEIKQYFADLVEKEN